MIERQKTLESIVNEREKEAKQNFYRYFIVSKEEVRENPQLLDILENKKYAVEPIYDGFKCPGYKVYFERVTHAQLLEIEWMKKNYSKEKRLAVLDRFFGGIIILGVVLYCSFIIKKMLWP